MLKFIKSKLKFNQINFKTYKTQNLIFINRNETFLKSKPKFPKIQTKVQNWN